jgi:hypothetical protein
MDEMVDVTFSASWILKTHLEQSSTEEKVGVAKKVG